MEVVFLNFENDVVVYVYSHFGFGKINATFIFKILNSYAKQVSNIEVTNKNRRFYFYVMMINVFIVSVFNFPDHLSKASITRYIAVLTEQYYFSFEDNWII